MAKDDLVQKNIRFPEALWERVERAVGDHGNRSEFIRRAVEAYLEPIEVQRRLRALEERLGGGE